MPLEKKLIPLTNPLWEAIDKCRDSLSYGAFIEELLWTTALIQSTGIEREPRPGPGEHMTEEWARRREKLTAKE